jgi:hypothetical protein
VNREAGAPIDRVTLSCGVSVRDNLGTPSGGKSAIPFHVVTYNRIII